MDHYLDASLVQHTWDNANAPRLSIDPGDTVTLECVEASGAQITPHSTADDLARLSLDLCDPISGPIYINGAEPGDVLRVEVLKYEHKGWGWSGLIPDFGLLADEFPDAYLKIWRLSGDWAELKPGVRVPLQPFCGEMGVAPREPGPISPMFPKEHGGNLDNRGLVAGATVYLPVWVKGALFCCGDCHAAQGDGEVCGTGIEAPMAVTLRFGLDKGRSISELQFETPAPLASAGRGGYYVTTAHGPDLYQNARQAIRYMIAHLASAHGLTREEAYVLCSAAVDLRISEIVDVPNYMVSAYLPKSIFQA